ncbi:insulin receptor substrate 1-like [Emydura macquarii macquarii]|uniref:insulin receptor substrate 1-like n=1 Tax=Emydura macquarii macquarii TaxID=1129001 RepID=UPI00352B9832
MEGDPPLADVRLCGHLRKQKSERRRFFALRAPSELGPARLEWYESEKKFQAGGARPKRTFPLAGALNIHKRADARHRHLIVLYGRDGTFGLAAETAAEQQAWYSAMMELRVQGQPPGSGAPSPAPFREVWQVSLRPKGLGQAKNLVGVYRLCLAESTVELVRLRASAACLVVQLLSVRRCGHSENYFFLEVGRSAATGPGELWMQVEDLVVAQNIHETILEAMKALSEEGRLRGRSQSLASAPITVPARRRPAATPPPGQVGSGRRMGADGPPGDHTPASSDEGASSSPGGGSPEARGSGARGKGKRASLPPLALGQRKPAPVGVSVSYPEGLNRGAEPGYVAMQPGAALGAGEQAYVPMSPASLSPPRGDAGGYMLMSPGESWGPGGHGWAPALQPSEYVNMSPLGRSAGAPGKSPCPFLSLPRSYKAAVPGRRSCSSSASSESLEEAEGASPWHGPGSAPGRAASPASRSPGEYISIEYRPGPAQPAARMARADSRARRWPTGETCQAPHPLAEWGARHGAATWEEAAGPELGLNYIDLDLAKEGGGPEGSPRAGASASPHAYASIDFHRSQELQGCRGGKDRPGC